MSTQATDLDYPDGDITCKGRYFSPDGASSALPVVLVCPAWDGVIPEVMDKAARIADQGYIAMVVDVLGEGDTKDDIAELEATLGPFMMDRSMLLRRLLAAVDAAKTIPGADSSRMAVIGYCFGGLCALDLARSGCADIRAAVSLHGGLLGNDLGSDPINAPILILHGQDDPLVPPEQVAAFQREMNERQADWQLIAYGNTVHAFTRPRANIPGHAMYNEKTDRRSWQAMHQFLAEVL